MSSNLVESFNALPRKERAPSGRMPNEWHFDLRYIQLESTPSHIIALIQPQSQFIHIERLPIGLPANQSGIEYFPESGKEAAPEVAKALLHAFVNKLGQSAIPNAPPAFSPWKLTTIDKDLASAVSDELKRIGVRPLELCNIGLSKPQTNAIMQEAFTRLFASIKRAAGYTGIAAAAIKTPQPFIFWNFKLDPLKDLSLPAELGGDPVDFEQVEKLQLPLKYIQTLTNSRPPDPNELDTKSAMARFGPEMQVLLKMLDERPEGVVKADADAGDADAALDYGVRRVILPSSSTSTTSQISSVTLSPFNRLSLGLGCTRDHTKSRVYLIKAILSPTASDKTKATAHGALINWYVSSSQSDFRSRYLLTACHHANLAARLCRKVNPSNTSPAVLWFMKNIFERMAKDAPELYLFYKDGQDVYDARNRQVEGEREKMQLKRLKNPRRYRCAAVGCGVEADSGKMLSRCRSYSLSLSLSIPSL